MAIPVTWVLVQGLSRLSTVAASTAQTAAFVIQAGTKEITAKVRTCGELCHVHKNTTQGYVFVHSVILDEATDILV